MSVAPGEKDNEMGTRADFYVGRGPEAEWVASVAFDGYPDGIELTIGAWADGEHLFDSVTDQEFRSRLAQYLADREDVTLPEHGWPWPWEDSRTSDYAYAFFDGKVNASAFGHTWFDPHAEEPERETDTKIADFPNMKDRQNVTLGPRSGLIVFGIP